MIALALSPYHLTTRELPAMAALLLGDRVVVPLPVPDAGDDRMLIRAAIEQSPRYLRLLESWRWSADLWRSGVLSSLHDDEEPMLLCRDRLATLGSSGPARPLEPLMHRDLLARPSELLDRLCADMLRGGPDPGFGVPMACGLDAFASRHELAVIRAGRDGASGRGVTAASGGTASLVQRAEELLGQTLFSVALPVLSSASGRTIEDLRADLMDELDELRAALTSAFSVGLPPSGVPAKLTDPSAIRASQQSIRAAAERYTSAFAEVSQAVLEYDDDRGTRVTSQMCRIVGRILPADTVVRASVAALRTAQRAGPGASPRAADTEAAQTASHASSPDQPVRTLVISAMPT